MKLLQMGGALPHFSHSIQAVFDAHRPLQLQFSAGAPETSLPDTGR